MADKPTYKEFKSIIKELKKKVASYKKLEKDLKKSEDDLERKLFEEEKKNDYLNFVGVMVVVIDSDKKVSFINKAGCDILGYKKEEIIGKDWFKNFLPKRYRKEVSEAFDKLMEGRVDVVRRFENPVLRKDGKERIIRWNNDVLRDSEGNILWANGAAEDITDQRIAEEELQCAEERFKDLFESARDMIFTSTINGEITSLNPIIETITGWSRSEWIGKPFQPIVHPDDIGLVTAQVKRVLRGEIPSLHEARAITKDGEYIVVEMQLAPQFKDGKVVGILGIARDVTERKKSEEEIKNHELRLRSLLKLNKMIDTSEKEIMDFVTEEVLNISQSKFGFIGLMNEEETVYYAHAYSKKVMKECKTVKSPLVFPIEGAGIWAEAIRHRKSIMINNYPAPNPAKKGYPKGHVPITRFLCVPVFEGERIVSLVCVANKEKDYQDPDVDAVTSMLNDMWRLIRYKRSEEEKKEIWRQLLQSQKLESIGRLTGIMAHDFKNILSNVISYTNIILNELEVGSGMDKYLNRIKFIGDKSISLINKLLVFSHQQELDLKKCNLNTIIDETADMLDSMVSGKVKLVLDIKKPVRNIMADVTQIEHVLMNLAVNAKDAMPHGGILTIKTKDVELTKESGVCYQCEKSGSFVMMTVKDSGIGMTKEVQDRIFDPYYTTKKKGEGTGLGLSTVFGIIKQHGGCLQVKSKSGKGTTFEIFLPVAEK